MTQPNSTILAAVNLRFALAHITNYYDTDFFPRTEEFLAIAHFWPEVEAHILKTSLDGILNAPPLVEPWPKVKGGYRIVHRLEPLDSLIYTAMAKTVSQKVEESRVSPEIACSYRFTNDCDSFFGGASGFEVYRARCEFLAKTHKFVLCIDIADFYNKLYLHRLQNALQLATDEPPSVSKRIEYFLTTLNTKASQGIPVGPAASIVMSEAALTDVDKFLYTKGCEHVRYVDDFRIFGNSEEELEVLLQSLTSYLHDSHRLSLNSAKTRILESDQFIQEELNNQYQQEKLKILDELEGMDPYSSGAQSAQINSIIQAEADMLLVEGLKKLLGHEVLDLGLVRAIVRRAKANRAHGIASLLIQNLKFLAPAINDIALYLDSISSDKFFQDHLNSLVELCDAPETSIRVVRMWLEWFFSRHLTLLNENKIRNVVFSSERLRPQAQAAITLKSEAWIKERKTKLLHYAYWDRRSIILAATLLSKDEREKWLEPLVKGSSLDIMEKWMARWVLNGSPKTSPHIETYMQECLAAEFMELF